MRSKRIKVAACLVIIFAAIGYMCLQLMPKVRRSAPSDAVRELPAEIQDALSPESIAVLNNRSIDVPALKTSPASVSGLDEMVQSGNVEAQYSGNGCDRLQLTVWNRGAKPARYSLGEGTLFKSGGSAVVLLRPVELEIAPGDIAKVDLQAAATSAFVDCIEREFTKSRGWLPNLDAVLRALKGNQSVSKESAQAAVLAIMENAPLDLFAKFPRVRPEIPEGANSEAFKISTSDIIGALILLRDAGLPEAHLELGRDAQLKLEAMIDPAARDIAASYYGIAPDSEWAFWKNELLRGDSRTRHYALYGIAQRYPDVALAMLPEWVREQRLLKIYRLSAVRALAMTERSEAIPILRDLMDEEPVAVDSDLLKSARHAIQYLEYRAGQDTTVAADTPATAG